MEIEAAPVPQPETINVGFNPAEPEEADIERQLLEAEKNGTSIGEIEDAKQKVADDKTEKPADPQKVEKEKQPDNSEIPSEEEKQAKARDEKGKFVKADSQYDKAKKEKDRLTKGWSEFEAECKTSGIEVDALNTGKREWKDLERCKDFLRKQLDTATANERAQLEAERDRMQSEAKNRPEFSHQEYKKAAQEFSQAAWKALSSDDPEQVAKAKELFANAHACQQAGQRSWEHQFLQIREKDIRDTVKKYPELEDTRSEAGQAMIQLLNQKSYLAQVPGGFADAAEHLKLMRDSGRVSELEGENKQLRAERDEARNQLKAATSLAGAGSQAQPSAARFDDMSDSDQERAVERMFSTGGEFVQR